MLITKPSNLKNNAALIFATALIMAGGYHFFYSRDIFAVYGFLSIGSLFIPIWLAQRKQ